MKKTLTKAISLLMSAVMTISALSLANFSSFAETDSSTEQTIGNQDSDIKYGGLFGSMISDEINDSVQNNQEAANMDYTVYKIYHDPEAACVGVDYKAKTDCMLFVGFYNDEGTELITSITNDLTATDKGYVEMYATEALPDHYLIKAFIVNKEILNPLSKPCTYDKYTKQMQEILAKTTEDFEEENVVNLDNNDENNFVVLQDDVIDITPTETSDIYKGEDENGNYIFENAVEIAKLKKGDKVFVRSKPDMVAFIVDKIEIDDNNRVVIYHGESGIEDFIAFIKIDSNDYSGESLLDEYEFENENVTYEGRKNASAELSQDSKTEDALNIPAPKAKPKELKSPTLIDQFKYNLYKPDVQSDGNVKLTGSVILGLSIDLTLYYEVFPSPFLSIDCTAKEQFECNFSLAVSHTFKFGCIPVFSIGVVSICLQPSITISATGKLYATFYKTRNFSFIPGIGITHSETDPVMTKIDGKVLVDFKITANVTACLLCFNIVKFSPYIGIKFDIHRTDPLFDFTYEYPAQSLNYDLKSGITFVPYKTEDARKHNCDYCYTCDISIYFGISITVDIFKLKKVKWDILRIDKKLGSFHFNENGFASGKCNNYSRMIGIKAVDSVTKEPISGAGINYFTGLTYEPLVTEKNIQYTTDSTGQTSFYVPETLLTKKTFYISVCTDSGDIGIVNIGYKWQWDPEPKTMPVYTVYVVRKETALKDSEDKDKDKDKDKEGEDDDESKDLCIKTGPCGWTTENGIDIPTVFYVIYPDENNPGSYEDVCYIVGKGAFTAYKAIPQWIKKVVFISRDLEFSSGAIGHNTFEIIDLSGMYLKPSHNYIPFNYFNRCPNLSEVIFPPMLSSIEAEAFEGCTNLKHINLPAPLTNIGANAFDNCGFEEFTCPPNLKTIQYGAFVSCKNLKEVKFNPNLEYIGADAFAGTGLQSINIPASVTRIDGSAFGSCYDLNSVIINNDYDTFNSTGTRGATIFSSCTNIKKAIFNEGVTRINYETFVCSPKLSYVSLPSTLKTIEERAFQGTNISDIKLPEGLETISVNAFAATNLTNVNIPESVTFIGYYAFNGDSKPNCLKSIRINNPDCVIEKSIVKSGPEVTVYGHDGSTAEAFAKENNNTFVSLDKKPTTTTTVTTQTTTTTTTTTAATTVISAKIRRNNECVFIAVEDAETANAEADKLLAAENVGYFDQQKSDEEGVVSFFFIPKALTDWTYIFIEQVNHSRIYKTVITPDGKESTTWWYGEDPEVTMFGDSNGDGMVDLADAILIMQALANPNKYDSRFGNSEKKGLDSKGGLNGDVYDPGSGITGDDALAIQEYLIGKIPSLPVYLNK